MLSPQSLSKIDKEIAKYPSDQKQSAVMSALAIAQEQLGWLCEHTIKQVADYLSMPAIAVQEVATFYNMYDNAPVGKYKITVCTNLPCALSKGQEMAEYLKNKLNIDFNQTTACKKFTLKEGECMGACGDAPVMLINNHTMHSFMDTSKIDQLIDKLNQEN